MHCVTLWLHFPPGTHLRRKAEREFEVQSIDGGVRLSLEGFVSFQCLIWEGSEDPIAGWVSPSFDHRAKAPTLCIEEETEFPSERIDAAVNPRVATGSLHRRKSSVEMRAG